ncbi:MAG TPA: hypothetical protein VJ183_08895 [Chloroflexia bacterium]|nr:hypothetical protein [Chloroflexia bacterium]
MAMFSFVLGAVQGVVLHAYQNQLSRWLWSTVTSAALLLTSNLAYWLFQRLTQQGYRPVLGYYDYLPIGGAIVGCGLGLAQWLVLRGMTTGAHSWLWVTAWALATALTSVLLFGPILNNLSSWYGIGGWVAKLSLSALFTGGITGIFLLRLVRELDTVQE